MCHVSYVLIHDKGPGRRNAYKGSCWRAEQPLSIIVRNGTGGPAVAAEAAAAGAAAHALHPVDKADLDAVRGFLPGKLLGRMAALLALGILALAQMAAFDLALRNVLG